MSSSLLRFPTTLGSFSYTVTSIRTEMSFVPIGKSRQSVQVCVCVCLHAECKTNTQRSAKMEGGPNLGNFAKHLPLTTRVRTPLSLGRGDSPTSWPHLHSLFEVPGSIYIQSLSVICAIGRGSTHCWQGPDWLPRTSHC